MINEVLQWMVLAFLSVFVLGLTRQLGLTLTRGKEAAGEVHGPDMHRRLPRSVLRVSEREQLAQLMDERDSAWAAIIAVSDNCPGCDLVIRTLEEDGVPEPAGPIVALTASAEGAFRTRLDSLFDMLVVDDGRLHDADVGITPFVILVDRDLKVVHKSAARSLAAVVDEWRGVQPGGLTIHEPPQPTGARS